MMHAEQRAADLMRQAKFAGERFPDEGGAMARRIAAAIRAAEKKSAAKATALEREACAARIAAAGCCCPHGEQVPRDTADEVPHDDHCPVAIAAAIRGRET